jgi:hypothetical protein
LLKSKLVELFRRCNRQANIGLVEDVNNIYSIPSLKIRGIYTDERSEEDITFITYLSQSLAFCFDLIKS